MREQIERVIAELTERRESQGVNIRMYGPAPETFGRIKELEHAIKLLKAVIEDETNHTRQTRSSGPNDTTEQV